MSILANIPEDPNPLLVTIDFTQYVDGAKLSTLARNYFAVKGPELGVSTIEEYFATILLIKLKETLRAEAVQSVYNSQVKAAEELAASQAEAAQQIKITASEQLQAISQDIDAVALVKIE
jgi:hypothetical protein